VAVAGSAAFIVLQAQVTALSATVGALAIEVTDNTAQIGVLNAKTF
jgi:hypothetical protein